MAKLLQVNGAYTAAQGFNLAAPQAILSYSAARHTRRQANTKDNRECRLDKHQQQAK